MKPKPSRPRKRPDTRADLSQSFRESSAGLSHFNDQGQARMVDVGTKPETSRITVATGEIHVSAQALKLLREGKNKKGDTLAIAQVAGILGAKKTAELIPLCHNLPLASV